MRTPVSRFERFAGYFILLSLVALTALFVVPSLNTGGLFSRRTYVLHVHTDDGIDLDSGDKVTMRGIQVGEVEGLDFISEFKDGKEQVRVRITCTIYWKYREKITRNSEFYLVPAAVVGRGKIEIQPGAGGSPLQDTVVEGRRKTTITDRVNEVLVQTGEVISVANKRISDLEGTLFSLQKILDHVSEGEGALGRFLYEEELYDRVGKILNRLEGTAQSVETLSRPLADVATALPDLARTIRDASVKIDGILGDLEKGMSQFPEAASRTVVALKEGRKILESLKRNFLIRGNLPADPRPIHMAPASRRESLDLD